MLIVVSILSYGCEKKSEKATGEKVVEKKLVDVPDDMVLIPAGDFIMGSDEFDKDTLQQRFGLSKPLYLNEHPKHKVMLNDYYIDKYEITNKEYKEFTDGTGHTPPSYWIDGTYPPPSENVPVVHVDWYSADAFCRWAGKRLPTEAEWEKAARGTDGRRFPWGDELDEKKANAMGMYGGLLEVGHFKEGVSPYGVYDMTGNASEWTSDWYKPHPGNEFEDDDYGEKYKVTKGGGWGGVGHYSFDYFYRTSFRGHPEPSWNFNDVGFRCVISAQ